MSDPTNLVRLPIQLGVTGTLHGPWVLDVSGSPNGVVTAPCGTLALREDVAQAWQNTDGATSWTQLGAGGGGATSYADDVFVTWGSGTPADGGNIVMGVLTVGPARFFVVDGAAYTGIGGAHDSIGLRVSTGAMTVTDASVGPNSGKASLRSGSTDSTHAGGAGGNTGDVMGGSGMALATAGSSGNTGLASWKSGDSATGDTGNVELGAGDAGGTSGDTRVSGGTGVVRNGDVQISVIADGPASGVVAVAGQICTLPSALTDVGVDAQAGAPYQAKQFKFGGSSGPLTIPVRRPKDGVGFVTFVDLMFRKTGAAGTADDVIEIRNANGATVWASLDLNGKVNGDVMRVGSVGVTINPLNDTTTANQDIVVEATQGGTSCEGTLYYFFVS